MGVAVGVGHGAREPQGEPAVRAGPSLSSLELTIGHPYRRMAPHEIATVYVRLAIRLLQAFVFWDR